MLKQIELGGPPERWTNFSTGFPVGLKDRIHGAILLAILRAMATLHRVSTPKIVARNIARNIAAVEFHPTSATLRAINFFKYPPSAAFRSIL